MTVNKRRTTVLGLALAATLALGACGGGDEGSGTAAPTDQPSTAEQTPGEATTPEPDLEGLPEVVAEVNGEEVTRDEFVAAYESTFRQAAMQAQMGGGEQPDEDALKKQTADGLVNTELLLQEAGERGISASAQDVDEELASLAEQNQLSSAEEFLAALEQQGTSEDQARTQVETQVVVERLVADETGPVETTERQLRRLYERATRQLEQQGGQQQVPPFAQVRTQLAEQVEAQEQSRTAQALVDELREGADITINL